MNKKQWNALGFMFLVFYLLIWIPCVFLMFGPFNDLLGNNVYDAIYMGLAWFLACLCFIAMFACWICGWLEKEEAE